MQADARFIQHVQHPGESGTDLGRQTDALRLATAQGHRRAIQAQVVEPHIQQKAQAHADLPQHQITDLDLARVQLGLLALAGPHPHQRLNAAQGLAHADRRQFMDAVRPHPHRQSLGFEPQSVAGGTGHQLQILLQLLADRLATGIAQLTLKDRQNPLERPDIAAALAVATVCLDRNRLLGAMQQHLTLLITQLVPGSLQLKAKGFSD